MCETHLKVLLLLKNETSFTTKLLFSVPILANYEEKFGCGRSPIQMISPSLFRKAFQILSSPSDQWRSNRIQST